MTEAEQASRVAIRLRGLHVGDRVVDPVYPESQFGIGKIISISVSDAHVSVRWDYGRRSWHVATIPAADAFERLVLVLG